MMERIPNSNFRIPNFAIGIAAIIVCLLAGSAFWRRTAVDPSLTAFVRKGPLTARLNTTELQRELERAHQEVRQSKLEVQVADIERREAEAALTGVSEGEGALA